MCDRKIERGKENVQEQGFSGKMVLNICELDDTHLKQREGRWEGGVIEGRKREDEKEGWGGGG